MSSSNKTQVEVVIEDIEEYLEDLVTRTPIVLRFTAAQIADYHGVETSYISWGLQEYRKACGGRIKGVTTLYSIGTFNRGPASEWFIFTWPGMTPAQAELGGEMVLIHEMHSVVKEEIKPMLKNIDCQFSVAARRNRSANRGFVRVNEGKLDSYGSLLLRFRHDVQTIRPVALRNVAKSMLHIIDKAISDVDAAKIRVAALANGRPTP